MYLFKGNKKDFLNGYTNRKLANELEINEFYVSEILNSKRKCSKIFAYAITKAVGRSEMSNYFIKE